MGGGEEKQGSVRSLMALNFCIADVQNGMGPYVALFLQSGAGWNAAQIGTALAVGNLAQVLAQTPAGAMIDTLRQKRTLLGVGIALVAVACLATALVTTVPVVTLAQGMVGIAGALFPPCLAALALGLVGRARMDRQMGTNQAFNAGGNMFAAVGIGGAGYFLGMKWMFYLVTALCALAALCVWRIKAEDIDYELARGADGEGSKDKAEGEGKEGGMLSCLGVMLRGIGELFTEKRVLVFLISAVIFHFANAAMVPLVTEMLAQNTGAKTGVLYTSGYMLASQFVFVIVAAVSGRLASRVGRKPLFLFAFGAMAVRGVLYTLSHRPEALIAVQCMDGLGAGIFGVVGVLIVADLTKGTGRFNAAQGAIATAQGTGAFLSNEMAGYLAKARGDDYAFLVLAGIALAGLIFFWIFMPETKARGEEEKEAAAEPGSGWERRASRAGEGT